MYVCDRLHAGSLEKFKRETTYVQLLKWLQYYEEKDKHKFTRVEKWEHYFAKLFVILKGIYKEKDAAEPVHEKELIKFTMKNTAKKKEVPVTREQRTKEAKSFWSAFFAAHGAVNNQQK